jgi:hypothetical protein
LIAFDRNVEAGREEASEIGAHPGCDGRLVTESALGPPRAESNMHLHLPDAFTLLQHLVTPAEHDRANRTAALRQSVDLFLRPRIDEHRDLGDRLGARHRVASRLGGRDLVFQVLQESHAPTMADRGVRG